MGSTMAQGPMTQQATHGGRRRFYVPSVKSSPGLLSTSHWPYPCLFAPALESQVQAAFRVSRYLAQVDALNQQVAGVPGETKLLGGKLDLRGASGVCLAGREKARGD